MKSNKVHNINGNKVIYYTNGSGRDSYIYLNNGGF